MAKKKSFIQEYGIVLAILFVGLLAVGGWVYNNQQNLNYQREQEANRIQREEEQEQRESTQQTFQEIELNQCLQEAEDNYWKYVELNATSTKQTNDGPVYTAYQATWDTAEKNKQNAIDNCYRQ